MPPPTNPTTQRYLTLTPGKQKSYNVVALPAKKGNKLKKANEEKGDLLVWLVYYNRRQKVVNTETSV